MSLDNLKGSESDQFKRKMSLFNFKGHEADQLKGKIILINLKEKWVGSMEREKSLINEFDHLSQHSMCIHDGVLPAFVTFESRTSSLPDMLSLELYSIITDYRIKSFTLKYVFKKILYRADYYCV